MTEDFVKTLEKRRAALRHAIPDAFLAAYDALGRIGRYPVVVEVRSAHCGGCYLRLPPQLDSAIRRRQTLPACPPCRRLLSQPLPEPEIVVAKEKSKSSKRGRRISDRRPGRRERPAAEGQERHQL